MINSCLKLMSKYNTVWVVYSLFSCHKCTRWSHPILTFLTFHEIEFATKRAFSAIYQKYFWEVDLIC